ncbi:hypothetical protein [Sphingomonas sp.]|uniref:hypothetical protein n=1 Tax=Sphingomonas sp. TaxID=28214 RepID=UPI002C0BB1F3|nr:hypothetical protein [Sphingomonas sp.]HWK35268.1 hypothetical protein [Sphingomonas sp.]
MKNYIRFSMVFYYSLTREMLIRVLKIVFLTIFMSTILSCGNPAPPSDSLCDLPKILIGWSGKEIRWTGTVVGTSEHGHILIADKCRRRAIPLSDWRFTPSGALLTEALRKKWRQPGLVKVELSGKITERDLLVSRIYRARFIPMSSQAEHNYFHSRGF